MGLCEIRKGVWKGRECDGLGGKKKKWQGCKRIFLLFILFIFFLFYFIYLKYFSAFFLFFIFFKNKFYLSGRNDNMI